ncbi:MAG: hypothetical protein L3J51_04155 [Cocleimonas sp.]|nr:hypothetical protein [Cocleimonas sp.]
MKNKNNAKEEVYSATELSDLLSSPVFYSVLVLTFLLGLSSVFGFLQNPRKLKTVVDAISEKVSIYQNIEPGFGVDQYSSYGSSVDDVLYLENNRYSILSKELFAPIDKATEKNIQKVSFNYDITSKQFWGNLDSSSIESASEESIRKNTENWRLGTPLSSDYYIDQTDSIYALKVGLLRL